MSAAVAFGPPTRTVHAGTELLGEATWDRNQGAWIFRPEKPGPRWLILAGMTFDSRADLGIAVQNALDLTPR